MRRVEQLMVDAIRAGKSVRLGNTAVEFVSPHAWRVTLFGNLIASGGTERFSVTLAGWNTATTRSRINALLAELAVSYIRVFNHKGEPWATTNAADRSAEFELAPTEWIAVERAK